MRKTAAQIADEVVATPTKEMLDHFNNRTNRHIELVRKYCTKLEERIPGLDGLHKRSLEHDASKFESKEKIPYVWLTWRYKCEDAKKPCVLPTGMKRMIDEATEHHILSNAHHPEFHQGKTSNLVNKEDRDKPPKEMVDATKMSKLDLAEMVADWCAMSEERGNTPQEWAKKNVNVRWKYTPEQVKLINQFMEAAWDMKKTASEIGDEILQKQATSRWREAIRSGEVAPGPEAERLKSRMGVDPGREAEGLISGWRGKAQAHGADPLEIKLREYPRLIRESLSGNSAAAENLGRQGKGALEVAKQFSPAGVTPAGTAYSMPLLEGLMVRPRHLPKYLASSSLRQQLHGAILGHESSELSAARRTGALQDINKGLNIYRSGLGADVKALAAGAGQNVFGRLARMAGKPELANQDITRMLVMHSPAGGIAVGRHADPSVLLEEVRNTRMLSPEAQTLLRDLRKRTGEWESMSSAIGPTGLIPRHQMPEIGKRLAAPHAARGAQLAELFNEGARSPLSGFKALLRARLR